MRALVYILLCSCVLFFCRDPAKLDGPYFGNGVHNGWADQSSITIWTRLTKNPEMNWEGQQFIELSKKEADELSENKDEEFLHTKQLKEGLSLEDMEGACPGVDGEVQLSYYVKGNAKSKIDLDWTRVKANENFTNQWKLTNLLPGTRYVIVLVSRPVLGKVIGDKIAGGFTTPPAPENSTDISFSIVSCHDYLGRDSTIGHKIYSSMEDDMLDFIVHTGDIEYYDRPDPWAMTEALMRFKWDRLFALPLQRDFYSRTTSYFMKDDHDALKSDAYAGLRYGSVSFARGLEIFDKEQFPSNDKTYKTIRWGKDLQIWILEGRNYRSPNFNDDGPEKTILGKEQKEWLFNTVVDSDATFKIITSSTPILGPDRPKGKSDNHSNKAFEYEGTEIRNFINRFDNVFVCNGDRHWQYVSHFEGTSLWEFGCGAGSDSHAGGWKQENVKPEHRFLRVKGGYLFGKVYQENGKPKIRFEHRDVDGNVLHLEHFG